MIPLSIDTNRSFETIKSLTERLFPIHRTLVNEGYNESIEILKKQIHLNILKVKSGTRVLDWTVPKSWNVRNAKIKTLDGKTLIDFADNNLHLSAYSQLFNGVISHEQLLNHLNYREDYPDAIPYNFHYYKENWSFNVSMHQFQKLFVYDQYEIDMDLNTFNDHLTIGELFIQGDTEQEILITSYLCHPSMVNDNLSGVVTACELFTYLQEQENLYYSYRLIIVPETIGAISFLSEFPDKYSKVVAGFTLYDCAEGDKVYFKESYSGDTYIDKVVKYSFEKYHEDSYKIIPYWPGGSDERQFNAPGVRMPMGAITRTPAAEYGKYHSSLDNLESTDFNLMVDTLEKLCMIINTIEADRLYKNNYTGEPFFSKHNIEYPTFDDALNKSSAYMIKILASEIDGSNSLLSISTKWNLDIINVKQLADELELKDLIYRVE